MNKLKPVAAIGLMAALPLNGIADDPVIQITSQTHNTAPQITVRSQYDFDRKISLKLQTNPAFDVSNVLINAVSKLALYDANGVRVTSGFDVDPNSNLVIGFSGGMSEIIKVGQSFHGPNIIASFKDRNGNFVSPPKDALAVYTTDGKKLCFTYEDAALSGERMHFALLLDRSWSMQSNIDDVKDTAKQFLGLLPQSAMCAVANFGHDWEFSHDDYQSCRTTDFRIDDIKVSGATDIHAVLKPTYENFKRPYFNGKQKAVIIITDGYTLDDGKLKRELLSLKGDTLTFVYFIGGSGRNALEGVTDHFITHKGDVKQALGGYFAALGTAYRTQKVLSIKPCAGGDHAK
ncbi:MAG: VWA domain-containing protein [Candidatus Thiodiazotropha sp. (ex Lucina aurantia)]|nr:VWA domain-containing protein [Candidatus Thiodiazotropha taylori]MBV2097846.1 VWA domain-containing protein [Candidatus Thiodiazotropha sp. (ex Codakia orbicularis)]MBV2103281.1 VWA domain-containing protein [Candidatus Thiodiazotropha sp. (ex Lucina aurantia)]MBV2116356.1 VWA domain-containing protein [Candidatus Thiodiazotropha sp. (ex Lucina aurantia)]